MAKKSPKKQESEETLVDRAKDLLEKGKKDGKIGQKEILLSIPETPENIDALDALYEEMAEANITITATDASGKALKDTMTKKSPL
jgi:transaldolase